jgi:translation initiation factor IF-1
VKPGPAARFEGVVTEALPNAAFRVKLADGRMVVCHAAGKVRTNVVRIIPGARVSVELSPLGPVKGRIVEQRKD